MSKLVAMALIGFAFTLSAFAGTTEDYKALKAQLTGNNARERAIKSDIAAMKKKIRTLKAVTAPEPGQGFCDNCIYIAKDFCNKAQSIPELAPCKYGNCAVPLQPRENICLRVYKNKGCYETALTAGQRGKVDDCWMVQRDISLKQLEDNLDSLKTDLSDVETVKLTLSKKLEALEEDCPECVKTVADTKAPKADHDTGSKSAPTSVK